MTRHEQYLLRQLTAVESVFAALRSINTGLPLEGVDGVEVPTAELDAVNKTVTKWLGTLAEWEVEARQPRTTA